MAYISTQEVKNIRNKLKENFPISKGWKFSVRKGSGSLSVNVTVKKSPAEYNFPRLKQVNPYHLEKYWMPKQVKILETKN